MLTLIVGLGNPGARHEGSRHNVGFSVIDSLRSSLLLPNYRDAFAGAFTRGAVRGHSRELALLKPMTFMNLSGLSVQRARAQLRVQLRDVIVVHDELDLTFGRVRVKVGGGHAGHNGVRSLVEHLSSPEFVRVRMGVGRPPPAFGGDVADYVLSGFEPAEQTQLSRFLLAGVSAVGAVLVSGASEAMNRVNRPSPGTQGTRRDPEKGRDDD